MKNINIFFIHGWGFNKSFWYPLAKELEKVDRKFNFNYIDLGFFSKKKKINIKSLLKINILIVHSYGFNYFINSNINCDAVLNFFGSPIFLENNSENSKEIDLLKLMIKKFKNNPSKVLNDFYRKCGLKDFFINQYAYINKLELLKGLLNLLTFDQREKLKKRDCFIHSIYLKNDEILKLSNFKSFFYNKKHKNMKYLECDHHAFPYLYPQKSSKLVLDFLEILRRENEK